MGVYTAFVFSLLIGIVISEEASICNSAEDSLVPVTIFVTAEQYRACKEDNDCTFDSQCASWDNSGDFHDTFQGNSYFEICRKIHFKMEQLEAEYPDIKHLKLKIMQLVNAFLSEFEFECTENELVSIKILDFVKNWIEKMKVELEEANEMQKPEPIPILKTIIQEEVTAEPELEHESDHSMLVGSIRGIPGIHFPNYTEIPLTSFSCNDKTIIPGFYADLETGCQVFHLCYEHRRESFLCPTGTIFNQPILACDYWYSANCSQALIYYEYPNIPEPESIPTITVDTNENVEQIAKRPEKDALKDFMKFLPVKAKVTDIPTSEKPIQTQELKPSVTLEDTEAVADKIFDGILSLGSHITSTASYKLQQLPDPQYETPKFEHSLLKAKLATKASAFVPLAKAKKITSAAKLSAAVKTASGVALISGKVKLGSLGAAAALPIKAKKVAAAAAAAAALPIKAKKAKKVATAAAAAAALPIKAKKVALLPPPRLRYPSRQKKVATAAAAAAALPIKAKKVATAAAAAAALPIKAKKVATAAAAAAALPIKAKKVATAAAAAAALPIKAKKFALPIVKTKLASASIPLRKAKAVSKKLPIVKAKLFKLPLAKTKLGAASIPALKAKKVAPFIKMAALKPKIAIAPLKAKSAVLPLMKAKLAKAAISPLTKKTLALGYLKLLKAKKLALMG
ncbi:U-scoloptoxin(01)-Er1a like protein [Argiope bruennichi]|uniref:U-scoloptoxin(01)-Er1a like protein n=1 Tax=Argiope bruennichi TaxID=94029 RepID=A0A8T0E8Z8_ARGBR|nr:U-scoloptoxin(01)-Er1a like protein [Argiope bruennichi]